MSRINTNILRVPGASGQIDERPLANFAAPMQAAAQAMEGLGELAQNIAVKEQGYRDQKLASALEIEAKAEVDRIQLAMAQANDETEVLALQQELDEKWAEFGERGKGILGREASDQFNRTMNVLGGKTSLAITAEAHKHADARFIAEETLILNELTQKAINAESPEMSQMYMEMIEEKISGGTGHVRPKYASDALLLQKRAEVETGLVMNEYLNSIVEDRDPDYSRFPNADPKVIRSLKLRDASSKVSEKLKQRAIIVNSAETWAAEAVDGVAAGRSFGSPAEAMAWVYSKINELPDGDEKIQALGAARDAFEEASLYKRVNNLWGKQSVAGLTDLTAELNARIAGPEGSGPFADELIKARDTASKFAEALQADYSDDQREYTEGVINELQLFHAQVQGELKTEPDEFAKQMNAKIASVIGQSRNSYDRFPGGKRGYVKMLQASHSAVMQYRSYHAAMQRTDNGGNTKNEKQAKIDSNAIRLGPEGFDAVLAGEGTENQKELFNQIRNDRFLESVDVPGVISGMANEVTSLTGEALKTRLKSMRELIKSGLIDPELKQLVGTSDIAREKIMAFAHIADMKSEEEAFRVITSVDYVEGLDEKQRQLWIKGVNKRTTDLISDNIAHYLRKEKGLEGTRAEILEQFTNEAIEKRVAQMDLSEEEQRLFLSRVQDAFASGMFEDMWNEIVLSGLGDIDPDKPGIQNLATRDLGTDFVMNAQNAINSGLQMALGNIGVDIFNKDENGKPQATWNSPVEHYGGEAVGANIALLALAEALRGENMIEGFEEVLKPEWGNIPFIHHKALVDYVPGIREMAEGLGLNKMFWEYDPMDYLKGTKYQDWDQAAQAVAGMMDIEDMISSELVQDEETGEIRDRRLFPSLEELKNHYAGAMEVGFKNNKKLMASLWGLVTNRFEWSMPEEHKDWANRTPKKLDYLEGEGGDMMFGGIPSLSRLVGPDSNIEIVLGDVLPQEEQLKLAAFSEVLVENGIKGFRYRDNMRGLKVRFKDKEGNPIMGEYIVDSYGIGRVVASKTTILEVPLNVTPELIIQSQSQKAEMAVGYGLRKRDVPMRYLKKRTAVAWSWLEPAIDGFVEIVTHDRGAPDSIVHGSKQIEDVTE